MRLTYNEAHWTILETTEMGYTLASQDRLWTVFIFDSWSEDEFRHNRLYFLGDGIEHMAYDYDVRPGAAFFTTRREAEAFAADRRADFEAEVEDTAKRPIVYVINWGDDRRLEAWQMGDRPKLGVVKKGSVEAIKALIARNEEWRKANRASP